MLPLAEIWYRRLLVAALLFGLVGGISALLYSGVTERGIALLFGEPSSEPFSGQWWWIPLVAAGAFIVMVLRERTGTGGDIPGAIAMARQGWVEPRTAAALAVISAISLVVGASLGPSFGIIVLAGGFAAWFVSRAERASETERQEYALSGMAGGLGAIFAAPLFAAVMASELSTTPKRDYVAAFFPQFLAATIGSIIFFGVTGSMIFGSFSVPGYEYEAWHLGAAVFLGLASAGVLLAYMAIGKVVAVASTLVPNVYVRALVFGGLVGLIAFALPLAAAGGSSQLTFVSQNVGSFAAGLLAVVLLAKMLAVHLSLKAGFLGGTVFPLLFIGGTAGVLANVLFPEVPAALAVAAMISSVPGAIIGAPVSFILLGVGTVGIGIEGFAPIGIAVITANVTVSALQLRGQNRAVV